LKAFEGLHDRHPAAGKRLGKRQHGQPVAGAKVAFQDACLQVLVGVAGAGRLAAAGCVA